MMKRIPHRTPASISPERRSRDAAHPSWVRSGLRSLAIIVVAVVALAVPVPAFAADAVPLAAQAGGASMAVTAGQNLSFEQGLAGWTTKGTVTLLTDAHAKDGGSYVRLAAGASISQTVTSIPQGSYTLGTWLDGSASNNAALLTGSATGAPDANALLDAYLAGNGNWAQGAHRNVLVYNGQVIITITAGSAALLVDNVSLTLDSQDENPLQNWGFDNGLAGWSANDASRVTGITQNTDTGAGAVRLAAGGEIAQTIAVEPNTHYIVTARARVQRADTYTSTIQNDQFGPVGSLVTRTSTGNRVNIGVRGADGAVLRQAPAGTDGWSLVSLSFTTDGDDHEVTVYGNTIADQAYRDSVGVYTDAAPNAVPADDWSGNGSESAWVDNFDVFTLDDSYLRGADVSNLQVLEDNEGKYFINGVQQDALRILSNRGVNSVTSMIFVNAGQLLYDAGLNLVKVGEATPAGAYPDTPKVSWDGYFDKIHTTALAARAKALNLSYLPSFHLSDSFMSASKAITPLEWIKQAYDGTLSNSDLAHLRSAVYNHVTDTLESITATGVDIVGVKQGNEQNNGVVWPVGQGATSTGHAALISAMNDALRAVVPEVPGYVHTDNGYSTSAAQSFFKGLINNGAKIDGAAFSLYGGRSSANILNMAETINADPAMRYLDYVNVETAVSFTNYKATWVADNVINPPTQYYSRSVGGQYNWLLDYMQAPFDVPNPYGQTRGFYYWEIDWIPVSGIGSKQGVPADISTRTMFNNGNPAVIPTGSTQPGKSGDALDSLNAYLMRGTVKNKPATMQTPLNDPTVHAAYAVTATAPTGITLNDTTVDIGVGGRQRLQPVIAPTDQVLTDSTLTYSSADPGIATVSRYGYIVGQAAGSTTVTATDVAGNTATATVTVAPAVGSAPGNLVVKSGTTTLTNGQTISVKVLDSLQLTSTLADSVSDRMLTYTSSNPDVASFFGETWQTPAGELRAYSGTGNTVQLDIQAAGTTDLTIATADSGTSITVHLTSTKVAVTGVTLDKPTAAVNLGGTVSLGGHVVPSTATLYKLTWTSADPSIATVDASGVVKGVADGQTTITAVSTDNPQAKATSIVTVSGVRATGITLTPTDIRLQTGATRALQAVILPADADRTVTWASSNTAVATVDDSGKVTAAGTGTADITATTVDGSALTATSHVTVVGAAEPVTALTLDVPTYQFRSDFFADEPVGSAPTKTFVLTVQPATATNADIVWSSDTPDVATVDGTGKVTALKAGVAKITAATRDGSVSTSATVSVPALSESFESRGTTYVWGLTQTSSIPTMTARVTTGNNGKALVFTSRTGTGASALQKVLPTPVSNSKVVADFTYNVGTPGSANGAYFAIADSDRNRYLTLRYINRGELAYGSGGQLDATNATALLSGMSNVGTGFATAAAWYKVHVELDFAKKEVTFTVTARDNANLTATRTIPFDPSTTFTGDVARLQWWTTGSGGGTWFPAFDDVVIYGANPVAKQIDVDKTTIRLLPVTDTLAVSRQLTATVLPATASQDLVWSSSDEDVVTVSDTGFVSAAHTYDSVEDIVPGEADITVASKSNPAVKAVIKVVVTNTAHASEQFSVVDAGGATVYPADDPIALASGEAQKLIAKATGGDGPSDVAKVEWSSSDVNIATVIPTDRAPLSATVQAVHRGSAYVTVKVWVYGDSAPLTARMRVDVNGGGFPPTAPEAPTLSVANRDVTVTWVAPDDGGVPITGYSITLTPESGAPLTQTTDGAATSTTFVAVSPGRWTAKVTATNELGTAESARSSSVWIDTTAPVITGVPTADIVNEAAGLPLAITAVDPESGIRSLSVKLDGATVPATGTLSLAGLAGERMLTVTAVNEAGLEATATKRFLVVPVDNATVKPGAGTLSNTSGWATGLHDGRFDVVMNLWWGSPGSVFRLYENNVLIATKVLGPVTGTSQAVTINIPGRADGTYTYRGELINTKGVTATTQTVVNVTSAQPGKPVVSHDNWDQDGVFTATANMWWGTNATSYRFLLDGVVVGQGMLNAATPNAQSTRVMLSGVAKGTHTLKAIFSNAFGSTESDPVQVVVR